MNKTKEIYASWKKPIFLWIHEVHEFRVVCLHNNNNYSKKVGKYTIIITLTVFIMNNFECNNGNKIILFVVLHTNEANSQRTLTFIEHTGSILLL